MVHCTTNMVNMHAQSRLQSFQALRPHTLPQFLVTLPFKRFMACLHTLHISLKQTLLASLACTTLFLYTNVERRRSCKYASVCNACLTIYWQWSNLEFAKKRTPWTAFAKWKLVRTAAGPWKGPYKAALTCVQYAKCCVHAVYVRTCHSHVRLLKSWYVGACEHVTSDPQPSHVPILDRRPETYARNELSVLYAFCCGHTSKTLSSYIFVTWNSSPLVNFCNLSLLCTLATLRFAVEGLTSGR